MSINLPQNPGIGGLDELTQAEEIFLTTFAALLFEEGYILKIISGSPSWVSESWGYYVTNWSSQPTLVASITGGDVYSYVLNSVTRYRFVPTTYDPTQDTFYGTFSGGILSNPIVSRG